MPPTAYLYWIGIATLTIIPAVMAFGILTDLLRNTLFIALVVFSPIYFVWIRRMREKTVADFDIRILPKLRDWCDNIINNNNVCEAEQYDVTQSEAIPMTLNPFTTPNIQVSTQISHPSQHQ